jgi:parallel beta-helix repeat protein
MKHRHNWPPRAATLSCTVLLAAAIFLVSSPAFAVTLYVNNGASGCSNSGTGTSDKPFCSIKAAAAKAVAGDTVQVKAGTYSERVTLTKSGTGNTDTGRITFVGEPNVVVGAGQSYAFDLSGVSYVTIRGFTVSGTTSHGIRAILCSNVTLDNNKVLNAAASGFYVRDSSDVTLSGNTAEGSISYGIYLSNVTGSTLSGGRVTKTGKQVDGQTSRAVYVSGSSNSLVKGLEAFDNSDTGIYLVNGTTGIRIKGNTVHHNARVYTRNAAGIEVRSPGNIVEANISYANEDSGINLRGGGSDSLVINNISYGNGDHGIDVLGSPRPRIYFNSVYKNVTAGINVEGESGGGTVANNISVDNGINSPRTEGNIRLDSSSVAGTTANYNLVQLTAAGKMYTWNSVEYKTLAELKSKVPGVEVSGVEADPKWNLPTQLDQLLDDDDFRLQTGSPAIGSANADVSDAPKCDAAGHLRDGNPDRGAFEANATATEGCG